MKEKKQLIYLVIILLVVIGTSLAFFMTQNNNGTPADINVTTATVDDLQFSGAKDINISLNQFNFTNESGNISDDAILTAKLKANNSNKSATYNYYVYLNIKANEFVYTTSDKKPEIILSVVAPDGNEVKSIEGLKYTTINGVSGFDITLTKGVVAIANSYEIISNLTDDYVTQNWKIKVTMINLDSDQSINQNKEMNARLLIQKDEKLPFHEVCDETLLACQVVKNYSENGINGLYYHNLYFNQGAKDNSYRFAGSSENINNYVCFGSDDENCPYDNLYRIIGIFDEQIKLIKADFASPSLLGEDGCYGETVHHNGTYLGENSNRYSYCYSNSSSSWKNAELNTINLNTNYLGAFDTKWVNLISDHNWIISKNKADFVTNKNVNFVYDKELVNPLEKELVNAKIGLMYVSDYGYAISDKYWNTKFNTLNAEISKNNWLYLGESEWTLTQSLSDKTVYRLRTVGSVLSVGTSSTVPLRPAFYLNNNVVYKSGVGTKSNPMRIFIEET